VRKISNAGVLSRSQQRLPLTSLPEYLREALKWYNIYTIAPVIITGNKFSKNCSISKIP